MTNKPKRQSSPVILNDVVSHLSANGSHYAVRGAFLAALIIASAPPASAADKPIVVDGDSILVGGVEWRLQGFDTPEIDRAKCEGERRAALFAKRRLEELIAAAIRVETVNSGQADRYKRPLGDLILDGRNVREIMIAEGYARPYNGGVRKGWCSRDSLDNLVPGLPPAKKNKR